jgi:hypothetical protein
MTFKEYKNKQRTLLQALLTGKDWKDRPFTQEQYYQYRDRLQVVYYTGRELDRPCTIADINKLFNAQRQIN